MGTGNNTTLQAVMKTPSTRAQKEIYASLKLGTEACSACNVPLQLILKGILDSTALESALQDVIQHHEALQMSFSADGDTFSMHSSSVVLLSCTDLNGESAEQQQRHLAALEQQVYSLAFDPEQAPLLRVHLVHLSPKKHHLLITAHILVCDEWSLHIVARDLATAYNARTKGLEPELPPAIPFHRYIAAETEAEEKGRTQKDLEYWTARMTPVPEPLDIPSWKTHPLQRAFASARFDYTFDEGLTSQLQKLAKDLGMSTEELILFGWSVFLARICKNNDVVIGMAEAGQKISRMPNLAGHCITLLPLRFQVNLETTFRDYLEQSRHNLRDAYKHPHISYGALIQELKLPRDSNRTPLFSVFFSTSPHVDAPFFENLVTKLITPARFFDSFDLSLQVTSASKSIGLQCQFNTAVFGHSSIALYLQGLGELLASATTNPCITLGKLSVVPPEERVLMLEKWNETVMELPQARTLLDLFHETVQRYAKKDAIVFHDTSITYEELDYQSDLLAAAIVAQGGGKGTLIGIHLRRSHKMFIAILGVLKSGAGYVPLDPAFPHDRLEYMIEDSGLVALVGEQELPADHFGFGGRIIDIDRDLDDILLDGQSSQREGPNGDDAGYVIYTSGSTGKPKGVVVPHHGILNLLVSMRISPGMDERDRLLAVTTLSFDMAVPELYLPLITGATIVVAGEEDVKNGDSLKRLLTDHEITFFQATPSTWRMLLAAGWDGNSQMKGLIGGEALPRSLAVDLVPRLNELWNMYGPTETTVWSTAYLVPKEKLRVLVGRPIANTELYILDENQQLVPRGVPGELYIGGDGVTKGYLNRDELNVRAFVKNPFLDHGEDIIYRTGDLVRYRKNGDVEYISRLDHQVKLRGYRIELGEIESAITRVTGLKEVVVSIFTMSEEDQRLVAYIKSDDNLDLKSLKSELRSILPVYMLPQHYMFLDAFPLTVNGKIDRKSLPTPTSNDSSPTGCMKPRNDLEFCLLQVWRNVLKVDHIGITDNFFDYGGHSLLALTLVNEIKKSTGIDVGYSTIFSSPTIMELIENLDSDTSKQSSSVVSLQDKGTGIPLFCLCGINLYRDLAISLGTDQPVYAIYVDEEQALLEQAEHGNIAKVSVKKLAKSYRQAILRQQPKGPYQLAGISFGGIVAIETARLLQKEGMQVRLVALLDTILPGGQKKHFFGSVKHHLKKIGREGIGYLISRSKNKMQSLYRQHSMDEGKEQTYSEIVRFRELAYLQAMEDYQGDVEPYTGDVVLFRADDRWGDNQLMTYHDDYGWREYVQGEFTVLDTPGDHLGIIALPHVKILAEQLHSFLK
jgi:amino acid adenylation domain-containing protein